MTERLRRVLEQVRHLPDKEQDELAALIEEELAEREWATLFADPRSYALLDRMAAEATAEDEAGETRDLDKLLDQL